MRGGRLAGCLVCAALLLAAAHGCLGLHHERPVSVLVRDAETGKPVPGAAVRLRYPLHPHGPLPGEVPSGQADGEGVVRLTAAQPGDTGGLVEGAAPGYLPGEARLPAESRPGDAARLFRAADREPARLVLPLYAGPWPTVEFVLPPGFRGLIKARLQVRADAPCPPGQRLFVFAVPPSAEVEMKGPPLLRHFYPPEYQARYDGGPLLGQPTGPGVVGFWWLQYEGGEELFLVGTLGEYYHMRPHKGPPPGRGSRNSDAPGGGHRGRGRHGGGPAQNPGD